MSVLDWFRSWLYGLDELTDKAERIVYNQIPHLGPLFHYIRFFYLLGIPLAFVGIGPLVLLEDPEATAIVQNLVRFLSEIIALNPSGIVDSFVGLFSRSFVILVVGFVVSCLGTWAGDVFDDYVRMDIEKVEKGYSKKYLSPIINGKVDKPFVRFSTVILYVLCLLGTVVLGLVSRNLELVLMMSISNIGLSAYPDFYFPKYLQKRGVSKKTAEVICDFIQIYLYLIGALYASWCVFRPLAEIPAQIHLFFHLFFISGYVAFEYMDWESDRNTDHWTIANILPARTTCYVGIALYFLLVPFALIGSASAAELFLKLLVAIVMWALSSLFLVTFYKKPMMSLHGSYALLCSYPIALAALILPNATLLSHLIFNLM